MEMPEGAPLAYTTWWKQCRWIGLHSGPAQNFRDVGMTRAVERKKPRPFLLRLRVGVSFASVSQANVSAN